MYTSANTMRDLIDTKEPGWRYEVTSPSLPEINRSLSIPISSSSFFRKLLAFAGPGFLVAVGYMDPGNWATDLAGGSKYNYTLLSVIMLSNLMAILLQSLAIKLGVVTGRDLAQACRDHFSRPSALAFWVGAEIAIAACDLAEVIGTAIALNLLFHIPLLLGVCLTALDVLLILFLQQRGFRFLEALVISLIAVIGICFGLEIIFSRPSMVGLAQGFFIPSLQIIRDPGMLYIAIGILGATVMPHNLYLHSAIVQTRNFERTPTGKREAIRFGTIDSTVALMIALFVNAAILIVAAATFYRRGYNEVAEIQDAFKLLSPLLGVTAASTVFALALLASGQNSTLTGTLAGQVVMEGFLNIRIRPWLRRLITRGLAIVPAIIVTAFWGEGGTAKLLVLSQVVLSLQLSFAVVPLVMFTNDRKKMGEFTNPTWVKILAWTATAVIVLLNTWWLVQMANEFLLAK
jgi:manganese transport protein